MNGVGNTVLHDAILTEQLKLFKLVLVEKLNDRETLDKASLSDIKGNFKQGLAKCLTTQNEKGLTPLAVAINAGSSVIFRLLLELYNHIESKSP